MSNEISRTWLAKYLFLPLAATVPVVEAVDVAIREYYLDANEMHKIVSEEIYSLLLLHPTLEVYETGGVEVGAVNTGCGIFTDGSGGKNHTTLKKFGNLGVTTTERNGHSFMKLSFKSYAHYGWLYLGKHAGGIWRQLPNGDISNDLNVFSPRSPLQCLKSLLKEANDRLFAY